MDDSKNTLKTDKTEFPTEPVNTEDINKVDIENLINR